MLRLALLVAMVGGIYVLVSPAMAQGLPSLDSAGVRGVRYLMRDEARSASTMPGIDGLFDWYASGLARPGELVTPAQVRSAFERHAIQAELRFAKPFIISGALHSVARRSDRQIVVQFLEGGLADSQRRALAGLGARGGQADPAQILGGITGGRMHAGATAVLTPEHADEVAGWELGAKVTLHCGSAVNVPLAVLLNNCLPRATVIAAADRLADAQSDLVLARKPLTVPPTPERDDGRDPAQRSKAFLVMGYGIGLMGRNCSPGNVDQWVACSSRIQKQRQPPGRAEAVWQQVARDLDIPEAAIPRSGTPSAAQRTNPAPRR